MNKNEHSQAVSADMLPCVQSNPDNAVDALKFCVGMFAIDKRVTFLKGRTGRLQPLFQPLFAREERSAVGLPTRLLFHITGRKK